MAIVAFWGPVPGQVGNTSNLLASSLHIGIEYSIKTMFTTAYSTHSNLDNAVLSNNSVGNGRFANFNDFGFDGVSRLAINKKLESSMIKDYSHPLINGRLDFLPSTKKESNAHSNYLVALLTVLEKARTYYDLTMIDLSNEKDMETTKKVIECADLVVISLNQNKSLLDRFFIEKEWDAIIGDKPYMLVLGKYDPKSHFNHVNISRLYKFKSSLYTVPQNSLFMDSSNSGKLIEFFVRNRNVHRDDTDYFFFQEIRRFSKSILDNVGIDWKLFSDRGA